MRAALLLALALSGTACARVVRQSLIFHEEVISSQVGPNHVIARFDRGFLEANRETITREVELVVDAVSKRVNPAAFDADIHIGGRSPEIELRLVAEIKNARSVPEAVALLRRAERTRQPLRVRSVLRYWPEHAIGLPHRQGDPQPRLGNANPDHVFELHPLTRVGEIDLLATFRPVKGYAPGHAAGVFGQYEKIEVRYRLRPDSLLVETPIGMRNDVHFVLELTEKPPRVMPDGRFLVGRARSLSGELLLDSVRVVLVKDSPPERAIRDLPPGTWLHVWALSRVSLAGLLELIEATGSDVPVGKGKLPYELLIVGIYPEGP